MFESLHRHHARALGISGILVRKFLSLRAHKSQECTVVQVVTAISSFELVPHPVSSMRTLVLALLSCLIVKLQASYSPLREYAGSSFFNEWSYYGNVDNTTWGKKNAVFLPQLSC